SARTPTTERIKSARLRRPDRAALELASGRQSVPPAVPALLAGGGLGALLTYFLDPRRGKGRRAKARARTAAVARRGLRKGETQFRRMASRAAGTAERYARRQRPATRALDDAGLAAKVETMVFGDPRIPKGALNVNVEEGVVIVRGQVGGPDEIDAIEKAVRRIEGVRDVRNLLHTPGTPAPNKAAALRASAKGDAGAAQEVVPAKGSEPGSKE
ncbi:MAG: BON domain-containing protein, partial [Actinomycetota bacterium]